MKNYVHLHCAGESLFIDADRITAVIPDPDSDEGGACVRIRGYKNYISVDELPRDVMAGMGISIAAEVCPKCKRDDHHPRADCKHPPPE